MKEPIFRSTNRRFFCQMLLDLTSILLRNKEFIVLSQYSELLFGFSSSTTPTRSGKLICVLPRLSSFPSNAFETFPMMVGLTMASGMKSKSGLLIRSPTNTAERTRKTEGSHTWGFCLFCCCFCFVLCFGFLSPPN